MFKPHRTCSCCVTQHAYSITFVNLLQSVVILAWVTDHGSCLYYDKTMLNGSGTLDKGSEYVSSVQ